MGLNGEYASMAEAVGEAPPRTGITGEEYAAILWDCGDDFEAAREAVEAIDRAQTRDAAAWYASRGSEFEAGYRQALRDHGIEGAE